MKTIKQIEEQYNHIALNYYRSPFEEKQRENEKFNRVGIALRCIGKYYFRICRHLGNGDNCKCIVWDNNLNTPFPREIYAGY